MCFDTFASQDCKGPIQCIFTRRLISNHIQLLLHVEWNMSVGIFFSLMRACIILNIVNLVLHQRDVLFSSRC